MSIIDYFGINLDNWHSADADTLACLRVYNKLIDLSGGDLKVEDGICVI